MIDLLFILVSICAAYAGVRSGVLTQLGAGLGALCGLTVSALFYQRIAFLGADPGVRIVILLILAAATILFCYSLVFVVMVRIRRAACRQLKRAPALNKLTGAFAGVVLAGLNLWIVISIFSPLAPTFVAKQLSHSVIVGAADRIVGIPSLFSDVSRLFNPFASPTAFTSDTPNFSTTSNGSAETADIADTKAEASVLEVEAWGCDSESIGSGFWVGQHFILTNAHVVAGAYRLLVQNAQGVYTAQLVAFNPRTDYAVLMTQSDVSGTPLSLQAKPLAPGSSAITLGYPGGDGLTRSSATVLKLLDARGYDIYGDSQVTRSIYALQADIVPGDSGSPLLNSDGTVAGLVFGNSTVQAGVGYAIASSQLIPGVRAAMARGQVVASGDCTSD